jgi:hypothetical protein
MAKRTTRLKSTNGDPQVEAVRNVLSEYKSRHPEAKVDVRRYNSASIRVRVIDPAFEGVSLVDRDDELWELLEKLPDDTIADLSMLITLAPSELRTSMANLEFEDPSPSQL